MKRVFVPFAALGAPATFFLQSPTLTLYTLHRPQTTNPLHDRWPRRKGKERIGCAHSVAVSIASLKPTGKSAAHSRCDVSRSRQREKGSQPLSWLSQPETIPSTLSSIKYSKEGYPGSMCDATGPQVPTSLIRSSILNSPPSQIYAILRGTHYWYQTVVALAHKTWSILSLENVVANIEGTRESGLPMRIVTYSLLRNRRKLPLLIKHYRQTWMIGVGTWIIVRL